MSEVVPFPNPPTNDERRKRAEEARRAYEEKARADALQREQRLALLERARAGRKSRTKMSTPSERRSVARNLWDILDRLEAGPAGISKARVLVAAGKAQPEDSTKHLERYALRPGLSEVEEEKRTGRLVQKIQVYVDLARKAAELAGTDPDDAEIDVLQGSRYLTDLPAEAVAKPELRAADAIAEGLRRLTDRLAQKHNLDRYFADCERHRLIPEDPRRWDTRMIVSTHGSLTKTHPPFTLKGKETAALSRCPGVYLGTVIESAPVTAVVRGVIHHPLEGDQDYPTEAPSPPWVLTRAVYCIPTWDITLYLGPFGVGRQVVPVLGLQPMTRIKPVDSGMEGPDADRVIWLSSESIIGEHNGPPLRGQVKFAPCGFSEMLDLDPEPDPPKLIMPYYEIINPSKTVQSAPTAPAHPTIMVNSVNLETLSETLCLPRFFRHFDGDPASTISWTDERKPDEFIDFFQPTDLDSDESAGEPTVAPEGTILSLLERWLRGDLVGPYSRPLGEPLETELDKRSKWAIERLNRSLKRANDSLRHAIARPKAQVRSMTSESNDGISEA